MNQQQHLELLYQGMEKRLDFVIKGSKKLTKHFHGESRRNHITTFCLLMLDRLNFASEGIKALMPLYLKNSKLEFTIAVTVRPIVLDNLILMNAINIISNDPTLTNEERHDKLEDYCHE